MQFCISCRYLLLSVIEENVETTFGLFEDPFDCFQAKETLSHFFHRDHKDDKKGREQSEERMMQSPERFVILYIYLGRFYVCKPISINKKTYLKLNYMMLNTQ